MSYVLEICIVQKETCTRKTCKKMHLTRTDFKAPTKKNKETAEYKQCNATAGQQSETKRANWNEHLPQTTLRGPAHSSPLAQPSKAEPSHFKEIPAEKNYINK